MRRLTLLVLALVALLACLGVAQIEARKAYNAPSDRSADKILVIAPGTTAQVAQALAQNDIINTPLLFRAAAWFTRHQAPLRTGEYLFPAHASLHQVLNILRFGAQVQHHATIPEGLTSAQIAAILNQLPEASGHIAPPAEGSVLPQTYDYVYGTKRAAILARMQAALQVNLNRLWQTRDPAIPLQTPAQALILASIVQQETPLVSDMPMIASVYENRLRAGMKLQADPTVIFAASNGAQSAGLSISRADLANPSPYNTYVYTGLPPGPICSPGLAAVQAVLHPADSDALYFVSMNDGSHRSVFSHSLQQHLENIKKFLDKVN